jgi:hypothetical protein
MAVTELEPRIFEYTEENDVFEIDNNPGTAAQIDLADADAQLLQAEDRLAVLIKSVTAAPSQETVVVESVGAIGSGGSGTGYTAVTVRRGSSPINMTAGSDYQLVWIGNAVEETGAGSSPINKEPNYTYNYLQLFDQTIGESEDVKNSEFYAKSFFSLSQKASRARDHLMKKINWAMYLGERDRETAAGGHYRHTTGGLYEWIPTANKLSMSGKMSVEKWNEYTNTTWFKQGNNRKEKMLGLGPAFAVTLQNIFPQYYEMPINEKLSTFYGVEIKTLRFSGGKLNIYQEDAFIGTGYSNCAFIWDPDYLAYMYLRNRDIQVAEDTTDSRSKWNKTEMKMFGRIGLFRTYDAAHHFLYNPSAPA